MKQEVPSTSALSESALLSSAALGDMSPQMQACYENAYAKLSRGVALLPSEADSLEDRLEQLWDEADPEFEPSAGRAPINYGLVVALDRARWQPRPLDNVSIALLVVHWLLFAEELRAHPWRNAELINLTAELGGGWEHDDDEL